MPPNTYQNLEEIETRQWAYNTIETILTDISPVILEGNLEEKVKTPPIENTSLSVTSISYLKRSLSFLEKKSFSGQDIIRNSRRSQSTMLPNTQNHLVLQEDLVLLPQPSFSSRIRNAWHIDGAASVKHTLSNSIQHKKKSNQEQKGISIWKSKFKEYSLAPSKPNIKSYRKNSIQLSKFIMTELLTTEETYLNHLMTIKHFYMDPLLKSAKTSLVNSKSIEVIFAHIPELITLSNTLVEKLRKNISTYLDDDTKRNDVTIGRTFCDLEPFFEIYIAYAVNYPKSRKHLTKASSNIHYHQLIQDTMRKKDSNRLILSDYMISPIQRVTRYCLLLTDLLKHMNRTHPDFAYLERALRIISALAYAMNAIQ